MSLVTWSPAIGITAVCRIAPPTKTARSVVPPPMSIRQTPRSFSSSSSTAAAEASGCRTMSRTSMPQRRTHLAMFSTADTAPVTMCTLTSRRTPLMPSGSRTPSWPSMMNSCARMCRICWSFGIAIAFAVSITRSMSACVTSFSLIATMPLEFRLRMWLPAMPVVTSAMRQSAISSASSSTRWIDAIVASMLTTTPRFRPRDGCVPEPDDVEAAVGADLGHDRDDLRRADVEPDDEVLAVLHPAPFAALRSAPSRARRRAAKPLR